MSHSDQRKGHQKEYLSGIVTGANPCVSSSLILEKKNPKISFPYFTAEKLGSLDILNPSISSNSV